MSDLLELTARIYTCEGCGATFEGTHEEAFQKGWDTPERFMSVMTCPDCPIDKTVWWKVMHGARSDDLTREEINSLVVYNAIWAEANPEAAKSLEGDSS